ncbi:MAG: hypothetical protein LBE83_07720 [Propionibacteriaceae bacterium]|nr:hypothetical protein [Propionibacteriaceae bacterium]
MTQDLDWNTIPFPDMLDNIERQLAPLPPFDICVVADPVPADNLPDLVRLLALQIRSGGTLNLSPTTASIDVEVLAEVLEETHLVRLPDLHRWQRYQKLAQHRRLVPEAELREFATRDPDLRVEVLGKVPECTADRAPRLHVESAAKRKHWHFPTSLDSPELTVWRYSGAPITYGYHNMVFTDSTVLPPSFRIPGMTA